MYFGVSLLKPNSRKKGTLIIVTGATSILSSFPIYAFRLLGKIEQLIIRLYLRFINVLYVAA